MLVRPRSPLILLLLLLLVACADVISQPAQPPTPTPLTFTPLGDLLGRSMPVAGSEITTVAYVVVDDAGARLLEGMSFSAGAAPQPSSDTGQVWLGTDVVRSLGGLLQRAGGVRYAVVLARGRLQGPGVYGPDGSYRYQLSDPRLQTLAYEETSIAALLDNAAAYEGRLVRVAGGLLARNDSALLVEQLGAGGLPAPGTRQVKLRGALHDAALLGRLKGTPNGAIHFGQVQVEGIWRGGQLAPLAILPIS
jgi:hypothetical protein